MRLSGAGAWPVDRGAARIGPVQRPDFCDLAWPWNYRPDVARPTDRPTDRPNDRASPKKGEAARRVTYGKFEAEHVRGVGRFPSLLFTENSNFDWELWGWRAAELEEPRDGVRFES